MLDHWNAEKAHPPWDPDELSDGPQGNAYGYATGAWGGMSADAEFDVVEIESAKGEDTDTLEYFSDLATVGLQGSGEYIIKGLLYMDALGVLHGRTSQHKTFVMLDWAFHIAAGLPWFGRKTRQGVVVFVATEGGGGFPNPPVLCLLCPPKRKSRDADGTSGLCQQPTLMAPQGNENSTESIMQHRPEMRSELF